MIHCAVMTYLYLHIYIFIIVLLIFYNIILLRNESIKKKLN